MDLNSEEPDEAYWKKLYEGREKALNQTLEENTDISEMVDSRATEIKELEMENEVLKEENEILTLKAAQVEPLTDLLTELLAD